MFLIPFDFEDEEHREAAAHIWNSGVPYDLAITPDFVEFNCSPQAGLRQVGWLAVQDGSAFGCAHASIQEDQSLGCVNLLAVEPWARRQGVGKVILRQAESWLKSQGAERARLGGALRAFTAGLPEGLGSEGFFEEQGYRLREPGPKVWDVARDLAGYKTPENSATVQVEIRPVEPEETAELIAFLERAFPGRWHTEVAAFLDNGGRPTDILAIHTENGIDGFCWLTFKDSLRPLNRYYPARLPEPWGQFGPLGVGQGCRGRGYGGAIIDAAAQRLQASGVRGCVIDWTDLLDLYGKFGFQPYREYAVYLKDL